MIDLFRSDHTTYKKKFIKLCPGGPGSFICFLSTYGQSEVVLLDFFENFRFSSNLKSDPTGKEFFGFV